MSSIKSAPRILVVDDDDNVRRFLFQILQRESYRIAEAESGETALRLLAEQPFDLVISDLHMDEVGGLEVLEAAKKANKHTQVLIFTGFGSVRSAVDAIKKGAFDYLSKPVHSESLLFKVRKALERRELGQQLEEQQTRLDQYYRMLSRDLALAKRVQASLVPESFSAHGVMATVRYRPMIGLGGDFADIASNSDGRVYFTVIDVTGHGVSAALLVNRVCSEGRKLMRENLQPVEILQKLNRFFFESFSQTGLFLTALTVCIDTTRQKMSYAGSAHPPALLWRKKNGHLQELASLNMIIGFDASLANPRQEEVDIHSGDRLLIYTDGAIEAENGQHKPLGIAGLKKNLLRFSNLPLEDFADRMVETVKSYSGEKLRDDVLLLAAELDLK
ncbi:SpoIIE family protein phosphatase [candidate division KSB1 bacterium]|nr:SpoIIE family protein phosphatase [candidate division KSB1 bacterium]